MTDQDQTMEGAAMVDPLARLEALYHAHHDHLVRLAMVSSGDPTVAEDTAQEAFVRLGRVDRWPAEGTELAYLRRTVVNLVHGHHRKLAVRRAPRAVPPDRPSDDPAGQAESADRLRRVAAAVRTLPRRQRDCVVLHYFADLSEAAVAQTLGVTAGSVKTHLHRARASLSDALEELR